MNLWVHMFKALRELAKSCGYKTDLIWDQVVRKCIQKSLCDNNLQQKHLILNKAFTMPDYTKCSRIKSFNANSNISHLIHYVHQQTVVERPARVDQNLLGDNILGFRSGTRRNSFLSLQIIALFQRAIWYTEHYLFILPEQTFEAKDEFCKKAIK